MRKAAKVVVVLSMRKLKNFHKSSPNQPFSHAGTRTLIEDYHYLEKLKIQKQTRKWQPDFFRESLSGKLSIQSKNVVEAILTLFAQ